MTSSIGTPTPGTDPSTPCGGEKGKKLLWPCLKDAPDDQNYRYHACQDIVELLKHCDSTDTLPETYSQLSERLRGAEQFYWQIFPIITAAEAFIFYISLGSGADFDNGRLLASLIGLGFVIICSYSFYVNKSVIDIYTKRLYWFELVTKRCRLHGNGLMAIANKRWFRLSLYYAWQTFFAFLITCHAMNIVWVVYPRGFEWWIPAVVGGLALLPFIFSKIGWIAKKIRNMGKQRCECHWSSSKNIAMQRRLRCQDCGNNEERFECPCEKCGTGRRNLQAGSAPANASIAGDL